LHFNNNEIKLTTYVGVYIILRRYETKNFQEVKLERTTGMEQNFQLGQELNLKSPKTISPQNQIKENMIFETMKKLHTENKILLSCFKKNVLWVA
jgi:hypothetical protein